MRDRIAKTRRLSKQLEQSIVAGSDIADLLRGVATVDLGSRYFVVDEPVQLRGAQSVFEPTFLHGLMGSVFVATHEAMGASRSDSYLHLVGCSRAALWSALSVVWLIRHCADSTTGFLRCLRALRGSDLAEKGTFIQMGGSACDYDTYLARSMRWVGDAWDLPSTDESLVDAIVEQLERATAVEVEAGLLREYRRESGRLASRGPDVPSAGDLRAFLGRMSEAEVVERYATGGLHALLRCLDDYGARRRGLAP